MKHIACIVALWAFFINCNAQPTSKLPYGAKSNEELTIYVYPGTELMAIVQILAGKYSDQTPSLYNEEMKTWFLPFKEHAAVKYLESFSKKLYTDFIELGWCFDNFPEVTLSVPEKIHWYGYYGKDSVIQYLNLVKQFYADTKFWEFYHNHEKAYAAWGEAMKKKVAEKGALQKLYNFYNSAQKGKWYIGIEPLNGWGAHAIPYIKDINSNYRDYTVYETGYFNDNATTKSEPVFSLNDNDVQELLWHEGSHHMIRHLMDTYKNEILKLSSLFNKEDDGMKRNNISTWEYCLEENIVRSVVACLIKEHLTERRYEKEIDIQDYMDFLYVKKIAPLIYSMFIQSKKYKSFDALFPEILRLLKTMAALKPEKSK